MELPRRMTVVRLRDSRLVNSHGSPIEEHPGQALRDLAGSLA